eukprot:479565-Pleurochrysis_carterae.AAC.2
MRLPRSMPVRATFATDDARQQHARKHKVEALMEVMPESMVRHVICGKQQGALPDDEVCVQMMTAVLTSCVGPKGDILREPEKP